MTSVLHRWEVTESEQYPGMFELIGTDGGLIRYYLSTTPCGRICLRKCAKQVWDEPSTPRASEQKENP